MDEILTWLGAHWQWLFGFLGIPAFFKSFRKRVADIWRSPNRIDKLEEDLLQKVDGLSQDHAEAAEQREKNKKEINKRVDKLEEKLDDVDKKLERILGVMTGEPE